MRNPVYLRAEKRLAEEPVFGRFLMPFLGGCPLIGRRWFSVLAGAYFKSACSGRKIGGFIQAHRIDTGEILNYENGFSCFNDFFIRKLKPGARPFPADGNLLCSPADSRLSVYPVNGGTVLSVKGDSYTLSELLCDPALAERYRGGLCFVFRLSPADYHRFAFIDDGEILLTREIKGAYHSVNTFFVPITVHARNYRNVTVARLARFGTAAQIEVGAMNVGSIVQHKTEGSFRRGEEKGYFQLGGSTVILLLEGGQVVPDGDIHHYSKKGIETVVRQGERIAVKA